MIFVTIGTSEPFDRLLAPLASLEAEDLLVQHGDSGIELQNARMVSYLEFDELVCAGGSGTSITRNCFGCSSWMAFMGVMPGEGAARKRTRSR